MIRMQEEEWRAFISEGTRTGKLATVRSDGRPHTVPIWFIFDGVDLIFMTGDTTVKVQNIRREPRVAIAVDEEQFPYSFVTIEGIATIHELSPAELLPYSVDIAQRYVGEEQAAQFGARNAVEGEVLIRVRPTKVISAKDLAD
ncbi:MAG: PPOX class F420-dependent oxidoreductase [Chloroflexota bacterium]